MKIVGKINKIFSMGAELERVIHKEFTVEAEVKLVIFAIAGLAQLDEITWVTELAARIDRVDDGVDIQIRIVLDLMWGTIV